MITDLLASDVFGALLALKPHKYVVHLAVAVAAFGGAMNDDKVLARVVGFVVLLITGGGLLILGIQKGTAVDGILGLALLGAAAYSWWYTRS